jgi:hypothetical protein
MTLPASNSDTQMLYSTWHAIVKGKMRVTLLFLPMSIMLFIYSTASGAKYSPKMEASWASAKNKWT